MAKASGRTRRNSKAEEQHSKLFYAIENDDVDCLHQLLEEGVDANMMYTGKDAMGRPLVWSPLHLCSEKGREKCCQLLLSYGANIDDQDKWSQTPLMYAVLIEWRNIVSLLIEKGADLNLKERQGRTALHFALECSDER